MEIRFQSLSGGSCGCFFLLMLSVCLVTFLSWFCKSIFFDKHGYWSLCSVSLVVSLWLDRYFPKLLKVYRLCWVALCVCWGMPSIHRQAVQYFALNFTSYLHGSLGSARGESLWSSQASFGYLHNPTYVYGLLDPQEYVRAFKTLCDLSFPSFFF